MQNLTCFFNRHSSNSFVSSIDRSFLHFVFRYASATLLWATTAAVFALERGKVLIFLKQLPCAKLTCEIAVAATAAAAAVATVVSAAAAAAAAVAAMAGAAKASAQKKIKFFFLKTWKTKKKE